MAAMMAAAVMTGCGESSSDGPFEPKDNINWMVTSSPGGGSDIYTRMISDIMVKESLINGAKLLESNMRKAFMISGGSLDIFFTRPITCVLMLIFLAFIFAPVIKAVIRKARSKA